MKRNLLLTILLVAGVTGCDKKAANPGNFKRSLDESLKSKRNCAVDHMSMLPSSPMQDNPRLDALADAGLVSKAPAPGSGARVLFVYDLTGKGKATRTEITQFGRSETAYLCSGHLAVDKILNFTEPAEDHGIRNSTVTYTTKLVDQPDWQKSPAVAKYWSRMGPTPTRVDIGAKESAKMVLTNEGWKIDGEM